MGSHTVEKIDAPSMSEFVAILDNILPVARNGKDLCKRINTVPAYGQITNELLENLVEENNHQ